MSRLIQPGAVNLDEPRYDQGTYMGRAKHFFITTNPLNLFVTSTTLEHAKEIVEGYRKGILVKQLTEDELWKAKHLYDSAYHPDTKDKMLLIGRMSAQVPMNMTITGMMMTFYKTTPAVVFWQWINQSFNAIVNYTNRSGDNPISTQRLGVSYVAATTAATATALGLNKMVKNLPPLVGRYVPFAAVAAANCINIPLMRSRELTEGIPVFTEDNTRIGNSKNAAMKAIPQVVISRIIMATPGMMIPPILMQRLERGILKKYPVLNAPIQVLLVGVLLVFATPMCCALFPQKSSMAVSKLEPELKKHLEELGKTDEIIYFNKGFVRIDMSPFVNLADGLESLMRCLPSF
ncbi:hypothetical protein LSH36_36g08017 [Paralvinella palmiformis]|uniref:Sidoreflexin n=1 Tax=Paralvinella palmiformis TaxID=53620 RepID=A0AAD9KA84_9ANNE|nr:hypothetical protein LSH36_36g08017 [Paralvinella palmiformis]